MSLDAPMLPQDRHTPTLSPGSASIGIDVGGTKIAGVRIASDGTVLGTARRSTPVGRSEALVDAIASLVAELRTDRVVAIGTGLPGIVDVTTGTLVFAPDLGLHRVPIRPLVEAAVGLPVWADNDANFAAWAEYRLGAGLGHRHLILVTVGTGFGCGIIVDGRLLHGTRGLAGEGSSLILDQEADDLLEGRHLGNIANGSTVARLGREIGLDSGPAVTRAAQQGDDRARAILARIGKRLGRGLALLANLFDPSIIIVGGGVAEAGELLLGPARERFADDLHAQSDRPEVPIVQARFGNEAGALGAALMAFENGPTRKP